MPEQRVFVLHGSLERVQRVGVSCLDGNGVSVVQLGGSDLPDAERAGPFELMRKVDDWAENKKDGGRAFPTFRTTGEGYGKRYEVVHLASSVAQRFDAPVKDLWPEPFHPTQVGHLFRVVLDHCQKHGFDGGFPNGYWSGEAGAERIIQIVAIKAGCGLRGFPDIPALGELPEDDIAGRFRLVHEWAIAHGHTAAVPNFHSRDWNRGWGERNELTRAEQDLNHLLATEGWRVARVDPVKLSNEQAGLAYLLERG